jgi:hypothetical protein
MLAAAPASPVWGQAVTFTATVTVEADGSPVGEGVVTFTEGVTTLGSADVDDTGEATLTTSALAVAAHSVVASYRDAAATFADSASAPLPVTVSKAMSVLSVDVSPPTIVPGQLTVATVTAAAVAPGAGTPTGQIVVGGVPEELDSAGRFSFSDTLEAGSYQLDVAYAGDDHFDPAPDASGFVQVDRADTSMTLTSSANPAAPGAEVTFTAMLHIAAPADLEWLGGPQGSVQVTLDGTPFGAPIPVNGEYRFTQRVTAPSTPLSTLVGVTYSGDDNAKPSSASLQWSVAQPPATPPSGGTTPTPPSARSQLNATRTALATALRKGGLSALTSTRQTFSAPGPGVLEQKVFTPTAPKSALKAKKPVLIASARRKAGAAGPITFKLKATAAGRRMLRTARSLKLAIVTRFTPPSGRPQIVVSRLTVKAKAKRSATAPFGGHGWRVERLDR